MANFVEEGKQKRGKKGEMGVRVIRESFSLLSKAPLASASVAGLHLC